MTSVHEMRVRLESLYRAGRLEFPDKAADVSRTAGDLGDATGALNVISAQVGDPAALTAALRVCHDVELALARVVTTLNECAVGLVFIADDFARTDELAAEAAAGIESALINGPDPVAAPVPQPEDPTPLGAGSTASTPAPLDPDEDLADRDEEGEAATPEPEILDEELG